MNEFNFTEEKLKELLALAIKIGADSPELSKMPTTIHDIANGLIKEIRKEKN